MKKILLTTAFMFVASVATAEIFNVPVLITQSTVSPNDASIDLGSGTSISLAGARILSTDTVPDYSGVYNTETGRLLVPNLLSQVDTNVFGVIVKITTLGSLDLTFANGEVTGGTVVEQCQGRAGTKFAPGGAGEGQARFACNQALGEQVIKASGQAFGAAEQNATYSFEPADPYATAGFRFSGTVYNSLATVNQDVDVTLMPVPAAAWLFGSAILGLAGLRKRK